jgi:hypothetical protein
MYDGAWCRTAEEVLPLKCGKLLITWNRAPKDVSIHCHRCDSLRSHLSVSHLQLEGNEIDRWLRCGRSSWFGAELSTRKAMEEPGNGISKIRPADQKIFLESLKKITKFS